MILTERYNLKKPEYSDNADIAVLNENIDKLENILLDLQGQINNVKSTADKIYWQTPYKNKAEFTATGTWTVPDGVNKIAVWMQDGGNGSSGIAYKDSDLGWKNYIYVPDASSGAWAVIYDISVISGTVANITVGTGGAGGIASRNSDYSAFHGENGTKSSVQIAQNIFDVTKDNTLGQYIQGSSYMGARNDINTIKGVEKAKLSGNNMCKYELSQLSPALYNGGLGQFRDQNINGSTDQILSDGQNGGSGKVIIYY